ncbi:MAG: extracellular solute-binding protein [Clostridia bacterium]|jgi:arabinogalactan oligomer/maltooligosaccharide transport system substrate-binding protein|nr:extracellular solute-binding protein [Clostridia bacterium]
MKKRLASLFVCVALAVGALAGLTACGGDDSIELTVWGSAAQEQTFMEMAEQFKAANPDKKYKIKFGIGEEDMAYSNVSKDVDAAADVYCYSNDQLVPLLRVGALARIGGGYLDTIKADNSEESVKSGSLAYGTADEKVYGYPFASDNGYFMFYNKDIVSDEQAKTLEGVIKACEDGNKKIGWAIDVPWYTAGWFFAFGGTYSVAYDDKYVETSIDIDFDNENGIKASKAIAKLTQSKAFAGKGTDNNIIATGFTTGQMAVAVTGTWSAQHIKEVLGENYGVCKLPTVTVGEETVQLSSFRGYKLIGVNPHSKNIAEAHKLAAFLSSENMQKVRFEKHMVGPTNKAVAQQISEDETFAALNAQNEFAVAQTSVPSNFWEPLKNYGLNIIDDLLNEDGTDGRIAYGAQLTKMVQLIKGSVSAS